MSDATQTPWAVHLPRKGDGGAGPHDRVIVGNICEPSDHYDEGATCVVVAHVKGNPTAGGIPAANADLIVRAVNSHAELLASLIELMPYAAKEIERLVGAMVGDLYPTILRSQIERAKAAVRKATG